MRERVRHLPGFLSFFGRGHLVPPLLSTLREECLSCGGPLAEAPLYQRLRVCPHCRFHYTVTARERIDHLADWGTFKETHRSITSLDPLSFASRVPYKRRLFQDQRRTGLTEAVVTGTCSIGGLQAVLVILDFSFLGGSMGCVVGEKVALALEQAARKKLPLVAVVTSGGARLQEGALSLMQMAKTATAANRLHQAGLPFLCVMANPTTGQVYASFANLADVLLAEPEALVGFASLRVTEEATGHPLPTGAHTAEHHLSHGMIDLICDREHLKDTLATLLDLLMSHYILTRRGKREHIRIPEEVPAREAWSRVELARHIQRPTTLDYIERMMPNYVQLHGDRLYGDDAAIVCGLGHLGGQAVVFVGHDQRHSDGRPYPEGLRKAQRAMRLAAKFGLPLVTFIDTPGAHPGLEAEDRGIGNAVATTMSLMADLPTPSIAVIIGEGGSEGALALGVADRILMLENAIFSAMSPEAAASLLYRDTGRAHELAASMRLTAPDCRELGIVDLVVPEPGEGAHARPDEAARRLERTLLQEISALQQVGTKRLLKARYRKFRKMGEYSSHFRVAATREVDQLQGYVARRVKGIRRRSRPKPEATKGPET